MAIPPQLPRFRFTLRLLMLVIAVFAIGLTIYRQPWEEHDSADGFGSKAGFFGRTISYRYDLQGNRVRHGAEKWFNAQGGVAFAVSYVDDQLVAYQWFDDQGKLQKEIKHPDSIYERGKRHSLDRNVEVRWHRDGARVYQVWRRSTGEQLQSLVYDRLSNQVLLWNDRSAQEGVERLLADLPAEQRKAWLTKSADWVTPPFHISCVRQTFALTEQGAYRRPIGSACEPLELQIQVQAGLRDNQEPRFDGGPLAEGEWKEADYPFIFVLLRRLATEDYTLQVRAGKLCAVPISNIKTPPPQQENAL